jgi:hypothetical protein
MKGEEKGVWLRREERKTTHINRKGNRKKGK